MDFGLECYIDMTKRIEIDGAWYVPMAEYDALMFEYEDLKRIHTIVTGQNDRAWREVQRMRKQIAEARSPDEVARLNAEMERLSQRLQYAGA